MQLRLRQRDIPAFVQIVAFFLTLAAICLPHHAQAADDEIVIVVLGDSLTAGYGLPSAASFPARLERALSRTGRKVRIINAGVSGDTTAGGLARLDWAVPPEADAVIVELGANDALRGLSVAAARRNLDAILTRLRQRRLPVLLTGMEAPRTMGRAYRNRFRAMFTELAAKHKATLYPFFLDGVALQPELNQADGIHPNAKGVQKIVQKILPAVEALITKLP